METEKPSLELYMAYAKGVARKCISQRYGSQPMELKEEMEQEALIRAIESYERLDPEKSWKAFCYLNTTGAVVDYNRAGRGFSEFKWKVKESEIPQLKSRVNVPNDGENDTEDIDFVIGSNGVYDELEVDNGKIKWDLLARMASVDKTIHVLAMSLLGFSLSELQPMFGLTRERLGQMVDEFIHSFDDPMNYDNVWLHQVIYALGLCEIYGLKNEDNGLGWSFDPVDFFTVIEVYPEDQQLAMAI